MSLRERLRAMMSLRPAHYRAMLDELTVRLRRTAADGVLKPGDPMPDFVLPTAGGELVSSAELLAAGPLVAMFFRGDWCPFCKTTLTTYNDIVLDIESLGGRLIAITPDIGEHAVSAATGLALRFPVLCDVDSAVAMQFGVVYRLPETLREFYRNGGIDLDARHGEESGLLPMPGLFVADGTGIIRFAYVSGDVADRAEPEAILEALRAIAG
jgi:peroxiredoxin